MAKNKSPKHSDAEDYLAQVEWQSQQLQRRTQLPWYMEPKRKYKRVISSKNIFVRKMSVPVKILLTMAMLSAGYFLYKNDIKLLIALSIIGVFLFFMIRDASKKPKDGDTD